MTGEVLHDLLPLAAVGGGRAEIDTSAPFESVREAVDRFGGSAAWISHLVRRIFAHHKKQDQCCVGTEDQEQCVDLEEQTAQLEKELGVKERETLDVFKELESAKRIIADLKLKILHKQISDDTLRTEAKQPEDSCCITAEVPTAEPEEKQPEHSCCITEAPTAEPEEKQLPDGENAEADVEMSGGGEEQEPQQHAASVLIELEQAKANLNRTTSDLATIRASIESLRNNIATEKMLVERSREKVCSDATLVSSLEEELDQTTQRLQTLKDLQRSRREEDPSDIFIEIKKMTSEIEQLRNAANASKSEAMMLSAEIEQTKATIGTAEVRCLAAKKMEEAARAAEALALAEIKALLSSEASAEDLQGVDLSVEEYFELASKAREADESSRSKIAAAMVHVDEANQSKSESLTRLEEAKLEVEECKNALQEALKRVDTANRGKFAVEETIRRWRSETGHKKRSLRGSPPRFKHAAHRHKDSHCTDIVDVSRSNSLKPTLSIGQILSMKLMGPDGYDKSVSDDTSETSNVSSLGQILNRRQAVLYNSDTSANKKFSGKRKKFAFTGLSVFLAKQAKSKKKRESD